MDLSELEDGTYLWNGTDVIDYAERWDYGYIVGTEPLCGDDFRIPGRVRLFGVWADEHGKKFFDHVRHIDSRSDAMEFAALHRQTAIWELRGNHVLYV